MTCITLLKKNKYEEGAKGYPTEESVHLICQLRSIPTGKGA